MINIAKLADAKAVERQLAGLPRGLSFFDPILHHEAKEALEADGEVYLSESPEGSKNGLFIYDNYEATGTVFTRSKEAFDRFYGLKPSSYIFSELDVAGLPKDSWNIWQLDVDKASADHRFRHHVQIESNIREIEEFMTMTQPETNAKWVDVALRNGDKCFVVKMSNKIVGMAWMTIAGGVARSHGLYVEPKFRRMGITRDIFQARLIYLKSRHIHTLINEIAEDNLASSGHAKKIGEKIVGKIFLYASPESEGPSQPGGQKSASSR
jgi:RimJ/RimL family protein N-acetyltransferase